MTTTHSSADLEPAPLREVGTRRTMQASWLAIVSIRGALIMAWRRMSNGC